MTAEQREALIAGLENDRANLEFVQEALHLLYEEAITEKLTIWAMRQERYCIDQIARLESQQARLRSGKRQISFTLPEELADALQSECRERGESRQHRLAQMVEEQLAKLEG